MSKTAGQGTFSLPQTIWGSDGAASLRAPAPAPAALERGQVRGPATDSSYPQADWGAEPMTLDRLRALAEGLRLVADLRRAVSTVRDKEKADRLAELLSELHAQEVTK